MIDVRLCKDCAFCKYHRKNDWYECKQFDMPVTEDDYCSFGRDIEPIDDMWDDRRVKDNETD